MLWPSFWNPLSLLLYYYYETAFNRPTQRETIRQRELFKSEIRVERKRVSPQTMTMAQNWVSSFQTLKFAADISDFKTYFFLIMNLWIFLLVGQAIRQSRQQIEKGALRKRPSKATERCSCLLLFLSCCLFGSRDLREFATGLSPQITIQFSFCFPFLALLPRWQKTCFLKNDRGRSQHKSKASKARSQYTPFRVWTSGEHY